ncbi:MAG: hypothetical protein ACRDE2_09995 [Chitinophagaceae bacterium]
MAKQCGPYKITGTIDNVCFYRMNDSYYVRMKSSITRKQVMKDPAFRRTREHAALLGEASKIASGVYRQITGERKKHAIYRELTGKAMRLLKEGRDKEAVFQILDGLYLKKEVEEKIPKNPQRENLGGSKKIGGFRHIHYPVPVLKITFPKLVRRRKYFKSEFSREMRNDLGS